MTLMTLTRRVDCPILADECDSQEWNAGEGWTIPSLVYCAQIFQSIFYCLGIVIGVLYSNNPWRILLSALKSWLMHYTNNNPKCILGFWLNLQCAIVGYIRFHFEHSHLVHL